MNKKVYIVTGGSNGIGKQIVKQLSDEGHIVLNIDKDGEPYFKGDISNKNVLEEFYNKVITEYKKIDGIVNNACLSKGGINNCSYEDFEYVLRVGVVAPFYLTKLFRDNFNKNASIVNISSTRFDMSQENTESYSSAKGGITSLTHALAASLSCSVRVNSIAPGWIDTTNSEFSIEDNTQHTSGRVGKVEDIANMVSYLLSDKAKFINGQNIVIDGGMSKLMIYNDDHGWNYKKGE